MKAIVVGDDGTLSWRDAPDPVCGPEDVVVDVYATAQNRADLAQRSGRYPPPPGASEILGLEMAGVVREVGKRAPGWTVGDRVCALLAGGGYAERVAVPAAMLMAIPDGWSVEEAAAMPEVFFTAFLNLFLEAGLTEGESVLVHGGASGVGTAAIQLAREAGCRVFATAGEPRKVAICRELGAELAVDYRERDFAAAVRDHLDAHGGDGVDVILDMVGGSYYARNVDLLATGGRLVFISTLGGHEAALDIRVLMTKRAMLKGSTLRSRPLAEKVRIRAAFLERFGSALASRRVLPVIDRVLPILDVEDGHAIMRANQNVGKIVLAVR